MKTFIIIAASWLMSACTTLHSSQVSVFHEWNNPPAAHKTYLFERSPAQAGSPEHKLYEEQLRAQLLAQGFVEQAQAPRLKVTLDYATKPSDMQLSLPPYFYDPFWDMHFRRIYYSGRLAYIYPTTPFLLRSSDFWVRRYYLHQLEIKISEMEGAKQLADIRVSSEQLNPEISTQIPYLLSAAFKNFPGQHGSTVTVDLPVEEKK